MLVCFSSIRIAPWIFLFCFFFFFSSSSSSPAVIISPSFLLSPLSSPSCSSSFSFSFLVASSACSYSSWSFLIHPLSSLSLSLSIQPSHTHLPPSPSLCLSVYILCLLFIFLLLRCVCFCVFLRSWSCLSHLRHFCRSSLSHSHARWLIEWLIDSALLFLLLSSVSSLILPFLSFRTHLINDFSSLPVFVHVVCLQSLRSSLLIVLTSSSSRPFRFMSGSSFFLRLTLPLLPPVPCLSPPQWPHSENRKLVRKTSEAPQDREVVTWVHEQSSCAAHSFHILKGAVSLLTNFLPSAALFNHIPLTPRFLLSCPKSITAWNKDNTALAALNRF